MRTAPSIALDTLLNWPPLHVVVQSTAAMVTYRLMRTAQWQGKASPAAFMRQDRDIVRYRFNNTYRVVYPERKGWSVKTGPLKGQVLIW